MGTNIKVVTLNVKGLGSVIKRRRIEALLKKSKADIIFLQETHQSRDEINELKLQNINIYEKGYGTSKSFFLKKNIFIRKFWYTKEK